MERWFIHGRSIAPNKFIAFMTEFARDLTDVKIHDMAWIMTLYFVLIPDSLSFFLARYMVILKL